jgi:hypothetical protein
LQSRAEKKISFRRERAALPRVAAVCCTHVSQLRDTGVNPQNNSRKNDYYQ